MAVSYMWIPPAAELTPANVANNKKMLSPKVSLGGTWDRAGESVS